MEGTRSRVRITVEAEVRPTEDREKVLKAVRNVVEPESVRFEKIGSTEILVGESSTLASLSRLHSILRAERILDAARGAMKKGVQGADRMTIYLHKQAAYKGRLSFVSSDHESPMGAIRITIEHPNVREVIDWLAPPTVRGRPVFERRMPE
ncbi:UPF0201 protein [Aeropyrum pernix]|uniref:UPF0201 protein apy_04270 n=1 Tax=Aeropyrum pernix TaxID=56636 RepID=A0A401H8N7_AERPX|nr:RNA-binding domain-containing protein [Aeropyrum pernix]GBF08702.1 UPF0201 protein [Aeropyrum pernix]